MQDPRPASPPPETPAPSEPAQPSQPAQPTVPPAEAPALPGDVDIPAPGSAQPGS